MSTRPDRSSPTGQSRQLPPRPDPEPNGSGVTPLLAPTIRKQNDTANLSHISKDKVYAENKEELREIPSSWRWARMSEVCSRIQDGTHFSPKEQTPIGDFKYITAKNIKHWGLDLSELTYVPERVHRKIYKRCNVEKGDVLYIKDGVTTGIATVNTLDEEFSLLSSVALLKPHRDAVDPHFLRYYLNSPEGYRNMTGQMTGTAIKRLILRKIKAAFVPLPPIPDQRRIVAEIEKQFTRLDSGVAALRRVQANLKRYRAAVLKAACEGRLVPTEAALQSRSGVPPLASESKRQDAASTLKGAEALLAPSGATFQSRSGVPPLAPDTKRQDAASTFESGEALLARILTERRKNWRGRGKYREPAAPDTAKLPPLPEGWTWASVEQLGDVQLGRQRSPKNVSKNYPTKYLRAANITERGIDVSNVLEMEFSPKERERFSLNDGDLILSEASGSPSQVGKPAVWRDELPLCCFQNTVLRLRPAIIESRFVLLVLQHCYVNGVFAKVAGGVGINHLGAEKFSAIPFPLPPLAEQARIVAEAERHLTVVEKLEMVVIANLDRATGLRKAILQRAFTGTLVPTL